MVSKKLLYVFFFILLSINVNASHWQAGQISIKHLTNNLYQISMPVLRDCAGVNLPSTMLVSLSSGTNVSLTQQYAIDSLGINTSCASYFSNSACNGGTLPGSEYIMYSATTTLPQTSPITAMYSTCCRGYSTNLVGQAGIFIETTFYPNLSPTNSVPHFPLTSQFIIDNNGAFNVDYSAFDIEDDSLVYTFSDVLSATNTSAPYIPGFSGSSPMNGLSINSNTGQISYVPGSGTLGNYIVGINCKEYDRQTGALLSESLKEMIITLVNNPGTSFSNTPAVSNGVSSVVNATNPYGNTISGCTGTNIDFDLSFTHSTLPVSLWSPINYEIPGATFTVTEGITSTMHVSIPNSTPAGTYRFYVQAIDNNCYFATMSYDTFTLEVLNSLQASADTTICLGETATLSATGNNGYTWTPSSSLSCSTCPNPIASPTVTTYYFVTGSTSNNCGNSDTVIVTVDSLITYSGVVSQSNGTVYANTNVFLITYNPIDSTVTAIDTATTNTAGEYSFQTIEQMVWLKVAPDSASFPNEIPTYYNNAATFLSGDSITANLCDSVTTNFSTVLGTNPGGLGFMAGNVYQGAGKMAGVGDPVSNVNLLLVNEQDEFVQYWLTDSQGYIQFSNIPYGTYRIFVDQPKVDNSLAPSISINENSVGITYNFTLNSNQLIRTSPNSVSETYNNYDIVIYPNPSKEIITIQGNGSYTCEIIDLNGRHMITTRISSTSNQISISELPKGVYIIKLTSDNQTIAKRLIKN